MFRPGSVLKITMTNFVTYTYVEFRPGPNLNLVVGPNGTGKSTIVAAIILGLGGDPKIIGRGTKVSEYVKHGFSNASVEIVLQGPGEEDTFTVTREFDVKEKNTWKLNGKTSTQKDVCSFLKKLNIQVDNLCQFLPQDRVQDFTKMNKQELLKETKKALCRDDLSQKQQNLIEKHERHKTLALDLDKQVHKLQECQEMNARLEGKVKNLNKKKKYLEHIKDIERKMAWVEYETQASRLEEVKVDKAQATEIYEREVNKAKPIENSISNAQKKTVTLQEQGNKIESSLKSTEAQINAHSGTIMRMKETISEILNNMQTKMDDIEQREFEINSSNMKLDKLRSDKEEILNQRGNEAAVKEKESRFNEEIRKMSGMIRKINEIKLETESSIREKGYEIRAKENELRRIENMKQQRFEWLRRADSDAYNATLWLRENKNRFSGEIYEPIVTELNVTNQENAIYIENIISVHDRIAFVCTSKEDMNLFIRLMRDQQHLRVNVIHSGEEHSSFESYQPMIPIEQLKKYGFYAYAHSLFTGPEPIMKYLCRTYHIHCIPIGNNKTNGCFEAVPNRITSFFSDKYRFSTSYSKYTGEKSTKQSEIKSNGSLSMSVDAVRLDHIKNEIREATRKCEVQHGEIQNLDNKVIQLNERNSKLTTELQTLRGTQQKIKMIETKIQMMNDKLQDLKQKTDTKESVKQEAYKEIENVNKRILAAQIEMKGVFKSYTGLIIQARLNLIKINVCNKEVTFLKNKALEVRQRRQDAEETLNNIKNTFNDIKAQAKSALQKAKNLSKGFTPVDDGFEEFRKMYDEMTDSLEDLMVEKEDALSNIECLHTADDDEVREYEEVIKKIDTLKTSIEETNSEVDEISSSMDRLKEEYMRPLEELINQISERFGAAFESMGYAGEVIIYTGKNDRDFAQYGLSIMVTYRNGQRLQELNSITQSGGEKAVATATYLLSLQELTPVPFRCVDEINQGMDSINERKIFELLVDSTSQPNTPQYFLITPKLLPNLKFVPTMKIHFVHNGPFVIFQQQLNAARVR